MPLYDFLCPHCGASLEIVRPMREALDPFFCDCGVPMMQQLQGAAVIPDIAPYKAVAGDRAGKWISSRREHREFLKRNRLIEVGDAKPRDTRAFRSVHTEREKKQIREQMRPIVRDALRNDKRRIS